MDYQSMFTFMLEMAGTIAFAASGAMVGAQRGMDIFGVCVLGVVTAVGGGATRDIILGIVPPGMFQNPMYTIVATVTSCIVFAVMYWKQELLEGGNRLVYDKVMLVMDTVGLGVFTVMGVDKGISQGYMGRIFFLVFLDLCLLFAFLHILYFRYCLFLFFRFYLFLGILFLLLILRLLLVFLNLHCLYILIFLFHILMCLCQMLGLSRNFCSFLLHCFHYLFLSFLDLRFLILNLM